MTWGQAALPFLGIAVVVVVPGLLLALASGLRPVVAVTAAPVLSLGTVTTAIVLGSRLHLTWGIGPLLLATVLLLAPAVAVRLLVDLVRHRRVVRPARPARADLLDVAAVVAPALLAGGFLCLLVLRAMGPPDAVQQSWDAPFHLNAIDRAHRLGSVSPLTIAQTANLDRTSGFYPPLFHALAVLAIDLFGVGVLVAANLVAVVAASVVWPLSVVGLAWVLAPRRAVPVAAGAVVTVVAAFPVLLLSFGVLWPNLLGLAALPGALALLVGLALPLRPAGPVPALLLCGAIAAAGLYYAHPGTIFTGVVVALPLLVVAVLRAAARLAGTAGRRVAGPGGLALGAAAAVGTMAVAWWVGAQVWRLVDTMPAVRTTRSQNWEAVESYAQATGEALTMSLGAMHPAFVAAAFAAVGAVVLAAGRRVWVAAALGLMVYLYVLAAGTDDPLSITLTGFWYNDRFRLLAAVPLLMVPLAAVGAVSAADRLRRACRPALDRVVPPATRSGLGALALAVVLAGAAVATPVGTAHDSMTQLVREGYEGTGDRVLTDPAEAALYRRLAGRADPQAAVAGNPYSGAVVAGVLSGRPSVFGHLRASLDRDQELVATRFKDFARDRAVCDAVRRLGIGYVVEDTRLFPASPKDYAQYRGLVGLAGTPGLTVVDRDSTVTAYRVGACRG